MNAFITRPFAHQRTEYEQHGLDSARGIYWEQGLGKTKLILDEARALSHAGEIDALLVVAPNGVHANWVTDEAPVHAPDVHGFAYQSGRAGTQWHRRAADAALRQDGLTLIAMSYSAAGTKAGHAYLKRVLAERRCMYVLDESQYVKNLKAKRTKRILATAHAAHYRRVLTGTPATQGPFDYWPQIQFLDPQFWCRAGFGSFAGFRAHFGVFGRVFNPHVQRRFDSTRKRWVPCDGAYVDVLKEYRRLPQLREILSPIVTRLTKDDELSLPPKLYERRRFRMCPEQARLYREMEADAVAWLNSGEAVTAPLALTQLLRLQQIACGYVACGPNARLYKIEDCPRVKLLGDIIEEQSSACIVWARFTRDIDLIMAELRARGISAVRYDGQTGEDERAAARQAFQRDGTARVFVANPAAGGTGLTLTRARTVIYYSNSFSLGDRLQSEDRAHRIGQHNPVLYIDIEAEGTVDAKVISALRGKQDIAAVMNGDKLRELL